MDRLKHTKKWLTANLDAWTDPHSLLHRAAKVTATYYHYVQELHPQHNSLLRRSCCYVTSSTHRGQNRSVSLLVIGPRQNVHLSIWQTYPTRLSYFLSETLSRLQSQNIVQCFLLDSLHRTEQNSNKMPQCGCLRSKPAKQNQKKHDQCDVLIMQQETTSPKKNWKHNSDGGLECPRVSI